MSYRNMKVLGIDADSKKIAMVWMEGDKLGNFMMFSSNSKLLSVRQLDLISSFEKQINSIRGCTVYIEDSIFIQNFATSKSIAEIIGAIKYVLAKNNVEHFSVPVTSWKKVVIGTGRADKSQVKKIIEEKYPKLKDESQDIIDACGVALFGVKKEGDKLKMDNMNG